MKTLVTWDNHGYMTQENVEGLSYRDVQIRAAAHHNYWWEKGGLDNIPGGWEIVTDPKILRDYEIAECMVAFHNGNDHCQCGHKECPLNDNK